MTVLTEQAAQAAIVAAATTLMLPTVRTQAGEIADAAARDQLTHRGYLAELLSTEVDDRAERRRIRRIREARFPRLKQLADSIPRSPRSTRPPSPPSPKAPSSTPPPRSCSSATQAQGKHTS